jgi:hypothetical protein
VDCGTWVVGSRTWVVGRQQSSLTLSLPIRFFGTQKKFSKFTPQCRARLDAGSAKPKKQTALIPFVNIRVLRVQTSSFFSFNVTRSPPVPLLFRGEVAGVYHKPDIVDALTVGISRLFVTGKKVERIAPEGELQFAVCTHNRAELFH